MTPLELSADSSVDFSLDDDGTPVLVVDGIRLDGSVPITTTAATMALWGVGLARFTAAMLREPSPRPRLDA